MKHNRTNKSVFKRVSLVLIPVLICGVFAACGGKKTPEAPADTTAPQGTEALAATEPQDAETTASVTNADETTAVDTTVASVDLQADGMRAEIKDALDSYESFIDEYCEFMKKYKDSQDPASMLADYTSFMTKYNDMSQKIENLKTDLNEEESAYYAQVLQRCSEKLSAVQP